MDPEAHEFPGSPRDLIVRYLRNKNDNLPLPTDHINEVDFYSHTPDELSDNYDPLGQNEMYFFTRRAFAGQGTRRKISGNRGVWRFIGSKHDILDDILWSLEQRFCSEWRMVEYCAFPDQVEYFVICKVFSVVQKEGKTVEKEQEKAVGQKKRRRGEQGSSSSSKPITFHHFI